MRDILLLTSEVESKGYARNRCEGKGVSGQKALRWIGQQILRERVIEK